MLKIKDKSACRWDLVSLGEVMLRFDPGDDRIHTARNFRVWEGGGEYNVARNLAKCFRLDTAIVTALADNQIGRLVEDLICQGRVDVSRIIWRETDGICRAVRNGMYFMERGFGSRPPTGCSDRGNTAVSKLGPDDIDSNDLFVNNGARWFHTGGIFSALSESTAEAAAAAMNGAKASGAIVSYDLNYRESLWSGRGGREAANGLNRRLLDIADVVFGVEDFTGTLSGYSDAEFGKAAEKMISRHANLKVVATTLRDVHSASRHSIGGACFYDGKVYEASRFENADVLDRVGSGDAFAAGIIFGLLTARSLRQTVDLAASSAALSIASPGDGLSATLDEIERNITKSSHGAVR